MSLSHKFLAIPAAAGLMAIAAAPAGATPTPPPGFKISTFATAPSTTPPTKGPDDITLLGKDVFVGWQNGVGSMGEPNPMTGQIASTLIEYSTSGTQLNQWSLTGKIDGVGANPKTGQVVVTVNEDGNSSLYTVTPKSNKVTHYTYSPAPDSASTGGVLTGGGTDGVTVINGQIFVAASNPMVPNATATFQVKLHPSTKTASLSKTFADNATAKDAVTGKKVKLALTDPDSNALVPTSSPRFGGQYMLDAQGDQQLVFAAGMGTSKPSLTRLSLSQGGQPAGVDDVRWTAGCGGTLLIVDNGTGTIYAVKGPFKAGQAFASLDTIGANAVTDQVDRLNPKNGKLTTFVSGLTKSKGLLWLPKPACK